jgi:hypothetical protein
MRPLYDSRVSDLGPDDRVKVECACGHLEHLTGAMLTTAGVPPYTPVLDLKRRLKCHPFVDEANSASRRLRSAGPVVEVIPAACCFFK